MSTTPSSPASAQPANLLTALKARDLMARGALTSEELVRSCLDRIRDREDTVQAWSYVDWDGALERDRECDRTPSRRYCSAMHSRSKNTRQ